MSTTVKYSTFNNSLLHQYNEIKRQWKKGRIIPEALKCKTPRELFDWSFGLALRTAALTGKIKSPGMATTASNELHAIRPIFLGDYTNVFIESEELVKFLDETEIRNYELEPGYNLDLRRFDYGYDAGILVTDEKTGDIVSSGKRVSGICVVIHFPNETHSAAVTVPFFEDGFRGALTCLCRDDVTHIPPDNKMAQDNERILSKKSARELRIGMNLLMYLEAFPETLASGTPANVKFIRPDGAKTIRVSAHPTLLEPGEVSAHLRRGHFRRLTSDHYTKKRGQVVFVRSTMVKGHAKTVMEVAQ